MKIWQITYPKKLPNISPKGFMPPWFSGSFKHSSPHLSYFLLLSGSLRASYAAETSVNLSTALGSSGFLSGCHFNDRALYAFFISAGDADLAMPSI